MKGTLYLIPTVLAEGTADTVLPPIVRSTIGMLTNFLCENIRTSRRFVSELKVHPSVESLNFHLLDKDSSEEQIPGLLSPLLQGIDMGLLSESGSPSVADPGAMAVAFAHSHDISVVPLPGPSSLLLALMASGLNGQQFAFHGYLPVDQGEFGQVIKRLERESRERNQTQMFIETPYRNKRLFSQLMNHLRNDTRLCVAAHLTAPEQFIGCKTVGDWKKQIPTLDKVPATFLFLAVGK